MGKLLLWAIIVLAVLIAMRLWSHRNARQNAAQRRRNEAETRPDGAASETIVRCAHCGVHLPRSEALLKNGQPWCCEAHARLGHADNA